LKAIAAVLAPTKQLITPRKTFPVGQPPAATSMAASPNGMANTVWEILINSAHFKIENFTGTTLAHSTV
jgi:hypothetical protein